MNNKKTISNRSDKAFAQAAGETRQNLVQEFVEMLRHNKKWWLTPIILTLLLASLVILLGGSAAAPFIYTLF